MMRVTFCGHSQVSNSAVVEKSLNHIVEELIAQGASEFLVGGYGGFDSMAASAVRTAKSKHPGLRLILVIPYLDREYDLKLFDELLYPPLEHVPRRFAISKRNEWMVEQSDIIVAYVTHEWGGAYKTLAYAQRKKKQIVSVASYHI